jgi:hypothetical protein
MENRSLLILQARVFRCDTELRALSPCALGGRIQFPLSIKQWNKGIITVTRKRAYRLPS